MSAVAFEGDRSVTGGPEPAGTAPVLPMLAAQALAQATAFWRLPAVSLTGLLMPVMLFVFFILPHAHDPWSGSITLGAYMLASIGAYAVGSVMVFNFGVTVALERGQKMDLLMRVAPLPGWVFLLARVICALAFGVAALGLLFGIAWLVGGIELPPATWAGLGGALVVGAVPFIALGFALAYLAGPNAAPAVVNLVFIGMAFASGMLVRLDQMPEMLRAIAPYLPTYHYAQLAWSVIGAGDEAAIVSLGWLSAYAVGLFAVATVAYRREALRRFA